MDFTLQLFLLLEVLVDIRTKLCDYLNMNIIFSVKSQKS